MSHQRNLWDSRSRYARPASLAITLAVGILIGASAQGAWNRASSDADRVPVEPIGDHREPTASARESGAPSTIASVSQTHDNAPATPDDSSTADTDSTASPSDADKLRQKLARLAREMVRLQQRVSVLERSRAASTQTDAQSARASVVDSESDEDVLPVSTPEEKRYALITSGVDAALAEEILERESNLDLARLELRDRSRREGWSGSSRFRSELAELNKRKLDMRDEIGDSAFDMYLYATGTPNRVQVNSVIMGSAADRSGLQPGDVIEAYDDERVFNSRELRDATTLGERDEAVPVTVRRGDALFEAWLPRGPIGIRLVPVRVPPIP